MYKLTREGLKKLKARKKKLENKLRSLLKKKNDVYRNSGDEWHDNPTLYNLENEADSLRRSISEVKKKLSQVKVISKNGKNDRKIIDIGSVVKIEFGDGAKSIFTILDPESVDLNAGVISYKSPLGKALIGMKEGEKSSYNVEDKVINI